MKKIILILWLWQSVVVSSTAQIVSLIDSVVVANDTIYIVQKDDLQGLINQKGKELLPTHYDQISFFNQKDSTCTRWSDYLKVRKGNLYALTKTDGKTLTTLSFDDLILFPETCQASGASSMLIKAKVDGKFGLLNAKGDILIRPSYDDLFLLKDHRDRLASPEVACVRKQGKYGFMEVQQQQILPAVYDAIAFLSYVEITEKKQTRRLLFVKVRQKNLWGMINLSDKKQYETEYAQIEAFNNGLALVKKGNAFGFVDHENRMRIPLDYEHAENFRNGVALVKKNGKFGFIDIKNKTVKPFEYDTMQWSKDEKCYIGTKNGKEERLSF